MGNKKNKDDSLRKGFIDVIKQMVVKGTGILAVVLINILIGNAQINVMENSNSEFDINNPMSFTLLNWLDIFAVAVVIIGLIVFILYVYFIKEMLKHKSLFMLVTVNFLTSLSFVMGPHFGINITSQHLINFMYDFNSLLLGIYFAGVLWKIHVSNANGVKK